MIQRRKPRTSRAEIESVASTAADIRFRRVHSEYKKGLKEGALKRPDRCQVCAHVGTDYDAYGVIKGHHSDYSKPLDVLWLCNTHHGRWHSIFRTINRSPKYLTVQTKRLQTIARKAGVVLEQVIAQCTTGGKPTYERIEWWKGRLQNKTVALSIAAYAEFLSVTRTRGWEYGDALTENFHVSE